MSLPGVEPVYTCKQVAEHLGLSESQVRSLVADELMRAVEVGAPGATRKHVRIPASSVHEYLAARCTLPSESQSRERHTGTPKARHLGTRRVAAVREAGWALEVEKDSAGALLLRWRSGLDAQEARWDDPAAALRFARDILSAIAESETL